MFLSRSNARNASSISASENCRGLFLLLVELFLLFGSDCMCWNHCIVLINLTLKTLNINWNIDSVGAMSSNQGWYRIYWIPISWQLIAKCN